MRDEVARLWKSGAMREAHALSAKLAGDAQGSHPFRDHAMLLARAAELHEHGRICWQLAEFDEAQRVLDEAHRIRLQHLGTEHADTLDTLERLAALAQYRQDDERANELFTAAMSGLRKVHGDAHVRAAVAHRNYGAFLRHSPYRDQARVYIDLAMSVLGRLPTDHPDHIAGLKVDSLLRLYEGDARGALSQAEYAVELGTQCWHAKHPFVAAIEMTVAQAHAALGQHGAAIKRLDRAASNLRRGYGEHPLVALALMHHASTEHAANPKRGDRLAYAAHEMYRRTYARPIGTATTLLSILVARGKLDEATAVIEDLRPAALPEDIALYESILSRAKWKR